MFPAMNEHVHPVFRDILNTALPQTDSEVIRLREILRSVHGVLTLLEPEVRALGCGADRVLEAVRREVE